MTTFVKHTDLIGSSIPWLKNFRDKGEEAFEKTGIPLPKTEAWKYTKPVRFFDEDFNYNPHGSADFDKTSLPALPFEAYLIVFENGVLQRIDDTLPQEVTALPLIEALMLQKEAPVRLGKTFDMMKHPFAALNTAYLNEGLYLEIPQGFVLDKPLVLLYHVSAEDGRAMYNLRNFIHADEASQAHIIEYFCYDGAVKSCYFTNIVNEILIEPEAYLTHNKIQTEAFKAAHIALNSVKVFEGGNYKSFCLQTGADMARNETKVILAEEGASTQVDAAYMMNGWATLDTTTDIEHLVPNTTSNQLVKGVVGGQAKGVFQGKIHIAPHAVKTQGYQLHKALLLSDEAEIDVKPELEIFADDVKCSHGAACGQLDEEQLFYMQSRGISREAAKQLLVDAYLDEVIAKVDNEKVKEWIKSFLMI